MSPPEFDLQMTRITQTFGEGKVYNRERLALIWKAVCDLSAHSFSRIVDNFIASARYAPLPKDFQDAAYAERRNSFSRDVTGAAKALNIKWESGKDEVLNKEYGSDCKDLKQALEIQIERNRINTALKGES